LAASRHHTVSAFASLLALVAVLTDVLAPEAEAAAEDWLK
jgi:hypothetical protein